jgi:hypothetical protein
LRSSRTVVSAAHDTTVNLATVHSTGLIGMLRNARESTAYGSSVRSSTFVPSISRVHLCSVPLTLSSYPHARTGASSVYVSTSPVAASPDAAAHVSSSVSV